MRGVNRGEVWMVDLGMAAKVRPALLLTGEPAADELDLVTSIAAHDFTARQPLGVKHSQAVLETRHVSHATNSDNFYS